MTTGFSPGLEAHALLARLSARRFAWIVSTASADRMRALSAMVSVGRLEPAVDSIWPLEDIRAAYAKLEAGHVHGKIVIQVP